MQHLDLIDIPVMSVRPYKPRKVLSKDEIIDILIVCDKKASKVLASQFKVCVEAINTVKREYILVNNVLYRRV